MGCTSVTGKGLGSAVGQQKGWKDLTIGAEKILGPRVVVAERVTLDGGGAATVDLPLLDGVATDYIVTANDTNTSSAAAVGVSIALTTITQLTFKGTAAHTVMYTIIHKGIAI